MNKADSILSWLGDSDLIISTLCENGTVVTIKFPGYIGIGWAKTE